MYNVSEYWANVQHELFPHLEECLPPGLTPRHRDLILVLDVVRVEACLPSQWQPWRGRPRHDRRPLARAFLAKACFNLPTTEALIDRLQVDMVLRRLCGWERRNQVPSASTFSRAFAELAATNWLDEVHAVLVEKYVGDTLVFHLSRDSTAIEARERVQPNPDKAPAPAETAPAETAPAETAPAETAPAETAPAETAPAETAPAETAPAETAPAETAPAETAPAETAPAETAPAETAPAETAPAETAPAETAPAETAPAETAPAETADGVREAAPPPPAPPAKRKRGRPRKGTVVEPPPVTRLQRQYYTPADQTDALLAELPRTCGLGSKKNAKGHVEHWPGYKFHVDNADTGLPLLAVTTTAWLHDSQVAIPMARKTATRVTSLYDLMDSAYDADYIVQTSLDLQHVPIIDPNRRRGPKIELEPDRAVRYHERTTAERFNSRLKDDHGGRTVRVRGGAKVHTHLMFGLLVIFAEVVLSWIT